MEKLIKISAYDCPTCQQLALSDQFTADYYGLTLEVKQLDDLANEPGALQSYVIGFHLEGDGSVTVPIYVVMTDDMIQGSGEVKTDEELRKLLNGWQQWKNSQPTK